MPSQSLAHVSVIVEDYDDAIKFYTQKLGFEIVEDTPLTETKRWVLVTPPGASSCQILLARAANDEQRKFVGNQTGGRVFLFIKTSSFDADYHRLVDNGVTIVREPAVEDYGKVLVFADLYGNLFDLIEPASETT